MTALVVPDDAAGERADVALARLAAIPRSEARAALQAGDVTLAGRRVRPSARVEAGAVFEGDVPEAEAAAPQPEDLPLEIRYRDPRVLVVSKRAGMVTHPGGGHASGTLVNALLGLGVPLGGADPARPGIVHRLDKETSGLLLVARDDDAHAKLTEALKARAVTRRYIALVRGAIKEDAGTIDAPIGRDPRHRRRMAVLPGGRAAVTHYEVVDRAEAMTLLNVTLETGRTHQIRVHLSHLKHPVMGDPVYGGRSERSRALGLTRPFLHAAGLVFPHPDDGRLVAVSDDLPPDLEAVLRAGGIGWRGGSPQV